MGRRLNLNLTPESKERLKNLIKSGQICYPVHMVREHESLCGRIGVAYTDVAEQVNCPKCKELLNKK